MTGINALEPLHQGNLQTEIPLGKTDPQRKASNDRAKTSSLSVTAKLLQPAVRKDGTGSEFFHRNLPKQNPASRNLHSIEKEEPPICRVCIISPERSKRPNQRFRTLFPIPRIHENGHRAVIDQGNLHVRPKLPAFHPAFQQRPQFLLK